jgi:hypothetical protein
MSGQKKKYGFYSIKAIEGGGGTSIYSTPDGREVEVSMVDDNPEGSGYSWPDKVSRGEVVEWLRRGRPAAHKGR